jgi:two-component system sensor histidine kinase MtrB
MGQGANLESNAHELPADQVSRIGGSIRGQAERISRLADDLADVTRLDSSQLVLSTRPADLAQVVLAALASVQAPAGVEVRIPAAVEVLVDPRRLEQVVANLVDNGLEHGCEPVLVELAVSDTKMVEFTVTDSGTGIPEDLVPALFGGLRVLPRSDRDRSRGSGLGLSLAKGLLEAMGGRIAYETSQSGGARFRLFVPTPRRRPAAEPRL